MAYKYSFADNEIYGANDINAITKRLVTSGVEDSFTDGVAYNASRFNDAGKLLYTSGAVPESYLSLKVEDAGDGKILINPGKAFFDDGAVIEIEAGGETLSYVSGSKNYVYLKNDLINTNRCYPCCTVAEPEGDYVLLAEISEYGAITDKRTYAKGKLPGYQSVAENVMRIQGSISVTSTGSGYYTGSRTFDIGNNTFEYILTYVKRADGGVSGQTLPCLGIYDIKESSYLSFYCNNINNSSGELYNASVCVHSLYIRDYPNSNYSTAYITFSMDDGKLTVELNAYSKYGTPVGFGIDLILF
ncbi:MAG: hypothetical protein IJC10_00165 [Clostridia bacterium]|nr:hypothetical protein [Clostridia bacterium]